LKGVRVFIHHHPKTPTQNLNREEGTDHSLGSLDGGGMKRGHKSDSGKVYAKSQRLGLVKRAKLPKGGRIDQVRSYSDNS